MKTKRLVALMLALTMVFCFMAMSASAATTEIQPRGTCPSCTNGYVSTTTLKLGDPYSPTMTTCPMMGAQHAHYKQDYLIRAVCSVCGYKEYTEYTGKYCPYGG